MIQILRVLYIMVIGFLVYRMIKNGGCCGGHGPQTKKEDQKNETPKVILSSEEKKEAIDLEGYQKTKSI